MLIRRCLLLNPQFQSIENKGRDWFRLIDDLMIYGLMGIVFCLFFVPLNHMVEYAFFLLIAVWILSQLKNGTLKWIKTPLDIPILLYVVGVLVCVPWAVDHDYSFGEWRKALAQFLMFFFVVQVVKTKTTIYAILLSGAAGVVTLSVIESIFYFGQGRSMWDMEYRAGDLTGSSQWFSVYLVLGLPLLWIGWDMAKDVSKSLCIVLWLGSGIAFLGLVLSHTRGAWVAIGIQLFIYILLKLKNDWRVVLGGAGILVGLFLLMISSPNIHQVLSNFSSFTNTESMQVRFNTWPLALQDIIENPLTGIGLGKHSFGKLHSELGAGFHDNFHNTFLSRAVQVGIPCFIFYLWIFIAILRNAGSIFNKSPNEISGKLGMVTLLIVAGVIVRNLFDDMFNGTIAYLFWVLVGLFFSLDNLIRSRNSTQIGTFVQSSL